MIARNQDSLNEYGPAGRKFEMLIEHAQRVEECEAGTVAEIESLRQEVAEWDYPDVWVGAKGMTAVRLLHLQELNEGLPEEMRLEPGEVVRVEGTGGGIEIPEVGGTRLHALDVVRYLEDEMDPDDFEPLWEEVETIRLAKQNLVLVKLHPCWDSLPDTIYRTMKADEVPASLAEGVIDQLDTYAHWNMGLSYVIPETERVKAFLAEHGEYFG